MLSRLQVGEESPTINMTPMVDVMLCLLVFFMAATKLYDWDSEQFTVRVPEVEAAAPLTAAPDDLELTILAPAQVRLSGVVEPLDLPSLQLRLDEAQQRYPAQGVLIRGDRQLLYQHLADVLAVCESAGIRNVRLPVRPVSTSTGSATP